MRKAFVLAAGFGKRMGEYTQNLPKPLLPIDGKTLLDACLERASLLGVEEAICNTHYLGDKIHSHLSRFSLFPIYVSHESPEILGTGGGIATALQTRCFLANPDFFKNHPREMVPILRESNAWSWEDECLLLNPDTVIFPENTFQLEEISPEKDAILYVLPSPEGANYTAFGLEEESDTLFPLSKDASSQNTLKYYYIGLSQIRLSVVKDFSVGRFAELGGRFVELATKGRIIGKVFLGEVVDVGEREFYEKLIHPSNQNLFWRS